MPVAVFGLVMMKELSSSPERSVAAAAYAVIAGILLSGPIALIVVHLLHPQPPWHDAETFASNYHPIQLLPYVGGFLLIGACVSLVASLRTLVQPQHRALGNLALMLSAAFAALILLNYILQTTFVPSLARPYQPEHRDLIGALSMTNPRSLGWALEMWGYAVFGVATWLLACVFRATRFERIVAATYVANGIMSIAGALATMCSPAWSMTTGGLVSFAAWNLLMVVMATLTIIAMRRRE